MQVEGTAIAVPEHQVIEKEVQPQRDNTVRWVALVASLTSIATTVFFFLRGDVLLYKDAYSHLEIARRVLQSPTAGPAQLGYVWLPLPHVLMLPLVWNNTLYYDGLAGSITSMICYVVATVFVYKIVFHLTGERKLPALIGALVFAANPNILYMQSTPMTELLLFATMLGAIYGTQRWIQTKDWKYLFIAGLAASLASLARYEGWVMSVLLVGIVILTCIVRRYPFRQALAYSIISASTSLAGILFWMGWNFYYFHNPLDFQVGQYAKPSNWISVNGSLVGNLSASFKTYWYAMTDNLGYLVFGLAVAGFLLLLLRRRLALETLPALATLFFIPFFVLSLDKGQRPMDVVQVSGYLNNVRFGLIMVIPAAIFIGYLASTFRIHKNAGVAIATALLVLVGSFTYASFRHMDNNVVTINEGLVHANSTQVKDFYAVADYLDHAYKGGYVLSQSYGNEGVLFYAKIPPSEAVYEGSYKIWPAALRNPASQHIQWVVMHIDKADEVYEALHGRSALHGYAEVYNKARYIVYKRK
jgi:hypothetical protein